MPFEPAELDHDARARWDALEKRATAFTSSMLQQYRKNKQPDPNQGAAIWADIKRFLLDEVFHQKCAYCEGRCDAHAPQHAEHWRPKNAVTNPRAPDRRSRKVTGAAGPHPGYWWLALTWENLIPACHFCNAGKGKGTQFPIAGEYVFSPDPAPDLDTLDEQEVPLLLHPFRGEPPERHIGFLDDGHAFAQPNSELGRWTITVLDLNRQSLVDVRRERIKMASLAIAAAASDVFGGREPTDMIDDYTRSSALFSRAVADALAVRRRALMEFLATGE